MLSAGYVTPGLENPRYVPSPLPELLKSIEKCRVQQTEYHHPDFPDGDYVRIRRSNVRSEGGQASQLPSLHNMLISRVFQNSVLQCVLVLNL